MSAYLNTRVSLYKERLWTVPQFEAFIGTANGEVPAFLDKRGLASLAVGYGGKDPLSLEQQGTDWNNRGQEQQGRNNRGQTTVMTFNNCKVIQDGRCQVRIYYERQHVIAVMPECRSTGKSKQPALFRGAPVHAF